MKIEEILAEWEKDAKIDKTEIAFEAARVQSIHHKYEKMHVYEKLRLHKLQQIHNALKLAKHEFFTQGPSEETPKDWEYPAIGKVLNKDLELYMNADKQMIKSNLEIAEQREKIELLKSIVYALNNRGYLLKTIMDDLRWKTGLN